MQMRRHLIKLSRLVSDASDGPIFQWQNGSLAPGHLFVAQCWHSFDRSLRLGTAKVNI